LFFLLLRHTEVGKMRRVEVPGDDEAGDDEAGDDSDE
jgi:hypothetical protein